MIIRDVSLLLSLKKSNLDLSTTLNNSFSTCLKTSFEITRRQWSKRDAYKLFKNFWASFILISMFQTLIWRNAQIEKRMKWNADCEWDQLWMMIISNSNEICLRRLQLSRLTKTRMSIFFFIAFLSSSKTIAMSLISARIFATSLAVSIRITYVTKIWCTTTVEKIVKKSFIVLFTIFCWWIFVVINSNVFDRSSSMWLVVMSIFWRVSWLFRYHLLRFSRSQIRFVFSASMISRIRFLLNFLDFFFRSFFLRRFFSISFFQTRSQLWFVVVVTSSSFSSVKLFCRISARFRIRTIFNITTRIFLLWTTTTRWINSVLVCFDEDWKCFRLCFE